ncbi:unnamed protein product [Brugia timori]|uniref:ATP synthase subunit a n21 TaxHypocreales RepIDA5J074_GIBZE n=1 Tax=Brugia timori TaxID=42155 RepID=A0A0R3QJA4_9BILA|nr:unnamed protein product [Brugia timori]
MLHQFGRCNSVHVPITSRLVVPMVLRCSGQLIDCNRCAFFQMHCQMSPASIFIQIVIISQVVVMIVMCVFGMYYLGHVYDVLQVTKDLFED